MLVQPQVHSRMRSMSPLESPLADPPQRAAPAFVRLILTPGDLVARSGFLRLSISIAVWLIIALAAALVVRTVVSGPMQVAGSAAQQQSPSHLNVAVGPPPAAAAAGDVAIDADAPSTPADGSMSYTTEQVVERAAPPAPVAAPAPAPAAARRDSATPAGRRRRPGPRGPTLATDHAAATSMQGLY